MLRKNYSSRFSKYPNTNTLLANSTVKGIAPYRAVNSKVSCFCVTIWFGCWMVIPSRYSLNRFPYVRGSHLIKSAMIVLITWQHISAVPFSWSCKLPVSVVLYVAIFLQICLTACAFRCQRRQTDGRNGSWRYNYLSQYYLPQII